ncbi:hypothetical protein TSUD_328760 [Trifolium subterraneum]|uniref:RNA-directed DNA polymerase n=1 Tax=Trifolium subterraneum TaxID=3900 RepID=A0A2Z6LRM4_TRISU|nr:hypothetical protein TSUD_328760 [Trifolium subterraneum]
MSGRLRANLSARILEMILNLKFAIAIGLNCPIVSALGTLGINTTVFELKLGINQTEGIKVSRLLKLSVTSWISEHNIINSDSCELLVGLFYLGRAPGHDVECCYALKKAVQDLIRNNVLSFKDENPNVQTNPLPNHGSSVHLVQSCQEANVILGVRDIKTPLVCSKNPRGSTQIQDDIQELMDKGGLVVTRKNEDYFVIVPEFSVSDRLEMIYNSGKPTVAPHVICLPWPTPYTSQKVVPYRYNATMLQDGVETHIPSLISVGNVADGSKMLRSGRILQGMVQGKTSTPVVEVLMKFLNQAYVEHDVTLGQFGSIVGNVTTCNNLSFRDEELPEKGRNHNLTLHISVICKLDALSNVLVDTGSSLNVMSKVTLEKLSYRGAHLRSSAMILKAFDGSRKTVIGEIDLPISVGPHEFQITFQVMNIQASYSCLLGRPWIHEAGAVTSTLHQKLKFMREGKLVIVNGEEALLVSHLSAFSFISADGMDDTSFQGLSIEEKENKNREGLGFTPSAKMIKPSVVREPFENIFRGAEFINNHPKTNAIIEDGGEEEPPSFVIPGGICRNWVVVDVPSITPLSKLNINKPVEHNVPRPSPNFEFPVYEAVEEEDEEIPDEIKRLLDQEKKAIQPNKEVVELIDLGSGEGKRDQDQGILANIVLVPKNEDKVRMCVDYRDLNKVSPKDDFPLPHIDVLVDSTAKSKVFSFMDGFSGYNQIKMAVEDREKTSFITPWALSATKSGKFLGFIVSQKGIEVEQDKVRAIREMPAPQTEKQIRGFLGRLNYISRFISHMTATCGPIFKLLRKNQGNVWTEDFQKAFDNIKEYLIEPLILIPLVEGRPLIMYLTVLEESMGCVLGQHDESGRKEHAIYYLSKKFIDCESRYSMLEKTCCALAWAVKRLRHYLINHTTWLISKMDPIKYIFEKTALTRIIARWQMLLSEYDIEYRTQKAIKGSILADHLAHQPVEDYQPVKFDFPDEEIMYLKMKDCDEPVFGEGPDPEFKWGLIFDGAVNVYGSGIGAVIVTLKGAHIPFSAILQFDCTNNIAEYEACIMGIEEAIDLRITRNVPS